MLSPAERVFCGGCGTPIPVLIGAHPASGVTTLAEATRFRTTESDRTHAHPGMLRLLVARTHHAGLAAARETLGQMRGDVDRLLLVPDAPGRLPKPLEDQVRVLAGPTPVTRIPWVEAWRWAPGSETETFAGFWPAFTAQLNTHHPDPAPPATGGGAR